MITPQEYVNRVKVLVAPYGREYTHTLLHWPVVFDYHGLFPYGISPCVMAATYGLHDIDVPERGTVVLYGRQLNNSTAIAFAVVHELAHVLVGLDFGWPGSLRNFDSFNEYITNKGHGPRWFKAAHQLGLRGFTCCNNANELTKDNFVPALWNAIESLPQPTYPWKEEAHADQEIQQALVIPTQRQGASSLSYPVLSMASRHNKRQDGPSG